MFELSKDISDRIAEEQEKLNINAKRLKAMHSNSMDPFSEIVKCTKCGANESFIKIEYGKDCLAMNTDGTPRCLFVRPLMLAAFIMSDERLKHSCSRCGYEWRTQTKSQSEALA